MLPNVRLRICLFDLKRVVVLGPVKVKVSIENTHPKTSIFSVFEWISVNIRLIPLLTCKFFWSDILSSFQKNVKRNFYSIMYLVERLKRVIGF